MAIPSKKNIAGPTSARSGVKPAPPGKSLEKEAPEHFPLARRNFIFMIAAGALIVLGFLLMLGGGTTTEEFEPRHIQHPSHRHRADTVVSRLRIHGRRHHIETAQISNSNQ